MDKNSEKEKRICGCRNLLFNMQISGTLLAVAVAFRKLHFNVTISYSSWSEAKTMIKMKLSFKPKNHSLSIF